MRDAFPVACSFSILILGAAVKAAMCASQGRDSGSILNPLQQNETRAATLGPPYLPYNPGPSHQTDARLPAK